MLSNLFKLFVFGLSLFSLSAAKAQESSDAYIQQIQVEATGTGAMVPGFRSREKLPDTESGLGGRIDRLIELGDRLPLGVTVLQRGAGNTSVSQILKRGNAIGQFQYGNSNYSSINVDGRGNRVVALQQGNRSYSDIEVTGANKTVYHLQLGATPRLPEIPLRGTQAERLIIVDTGTRAYIKRLNSHTR
jgi:hypothetical protein